MWPPSQREHDGLQPPVDETSPPPARPARKDRGKQAKLRIDRQPLADDDSRGVQPP